MNEIDKTADALEHHILVNLLYASLQCDANRLFAGVRRPGKNTREILNGIERLRLKKIRG